MSWNNATKLEGRLPLSTELHQKRAYNLQDASNSHSHYSTSAGVQFNNISPSAVSGQFKSAVSKSSGFAVNQQVGNYVIDDTRIGSEVKVWHENPTKVDLDKNDTIRSDEMTNTADVHRNLIFVKEKIDQTFAPVASNEKNGKKLMSGSTRNVRVPTNSNYPVPKVSTTLDTYQFSRDDGLDEYRRIYPKWMHKPASNGFVVGNARVSPRTMSDTDPKMYMSSYADFVTARTDPKVSVPIGKEGDYRDAKVEYTGFSRCMGEPPALGTGSLEAKLYPGVTEGQKLLNYPSGQPRLNSAENRMTYIKNERLQNYNHAKTVALSSSHERYNLSKLKTSPIEYVAQLNAKTPYLSAYQLAHSKYIDNTAAFYGKPLFNMTADGTQARLVPISTTYNDHYNGEFWVNRQEYMANLQEKKMGKPLAKALNVDPAQFAAPLDATGAAKLTICPDYAGLLPKAHTGWSRNYIVKPNAKAGGVVAPTATTGLDSLTELSRSQQFALKKKNALKGEGHMSSYAENFALPEYRITRSSIPVGTDVAHMSVKPSENHTNFVRMGATQALYLDPRTQQVTKTDMLLEPTGKNYGAKARN